VVEGSPIDGGHCVMVAGFDADWLYVISWGEVIRVSWDFWDAYCEEAWAVISEDWTSVTELSLVAFGEEFAATFATSNPFAELSPFTVLADDVTNFEEDFREDGREVLAFVADWFRKLHYKGAHR
jgi:hypothetical protein